MAIKSSDSKRMTGTDPPQLLIILMGCRLRKTRTTKLSYTWVGPLISGWLVFSYACGKSNPSVTTVLHADDLTETQNADCIDVVVILRLAFQRCDESYSTQNAWYRVFTDSCIGE